MMVLRIWAAIILVVLAGYTVMVGNAHGWNLMPLFFGDIAAMGWPGQFNLDFLFMLSLSAIWVAWRHGFSATGLLLAVLAFNLGALFLAIYLLVTIGRARGDARVVVLGPARAAQ